MALDRRSSAVGKAKQLAMVRNAAPIDLAEALWKADQTEPGSVAEIIEETGLGRRRAYYLLQVWDRFAQAGYSKAELAEVGWTKLAIVAKYLPPGMEAAGYDLAQRNTAQQLPVILQGGSQSLPRPHSVLLRLTPSQYKLFAAVVLKHGATPAKKGKGLANKERALIRALRQLER